MKTLLDQLNAAGWRGGKLLHRQNIAGAQRLTFERGELFLKLLAIEHAARLAEEAFALERLRKTGAVRVPEIIAHGVAGGEAYLALEWLTLRPLNEAAAARFGHALAQLHRHTAEHYGWPQDNHIGPSPQPNGWKTDWCEFFAEQRLGFQLRIAQRAFRDEWIQRGFRLLDALPHLLEGHRPPASVLHGDLWIGNAAMNAGGEAVMFDPASYYGDRETDLAMTELFGGFPGTFYAAYVQAWPLDEGYAQRKRLYQLYHIINHANLFGGGYARQAAAIIGKLLKDGA
jgi:protein-ribulosamine 3-kinase